MKKILPIFLSFFALLLVANHVNAANSATQKTTPTIVPTEAPANKLNQQINQLKEKIASRVAELDLVEKRGIIGVITEVSANQITVKDTAGKTRFVDVDEITKFSSPGVKGAFGISDLTKGTTISALGLYNKQSKRILARFINVTTTPMVLSGAILEIDKKSFVVTIASEEQKQTKIDIPTTTKILTQDGDAGLVKYGFSKLAANDRVFVVGAPDKKDPALFIASRFIVLPGLPQNPNIMIDQPEPAISDTIKPSTGSGKKLTPIR